jgi:hypothetical protein
MHDGAQPGLAVVCCLAITLALGFCGRGAEWCASTGVTDKRAPCTLLFALRLTPRSQCINFIIAGFVERVPQKLGSSL